MTQLPRLFVGSSSEQLAVSRAIQANLDGRAEITIWNQGIFKLASTTLDSLVESLREFDAGIFVLAGDDVTTSRRVRRKSIRDNVIFELGLFMGSLGRSHCFIVAPAPVRDIKVPTDLAGITLAEYFPERSDKNVRAALAPACEQILEAVAPATRRVWRVTTFGSFQDQEIDWGRLFEESTEIDILFLGSPTWCHLHFSRIQNFLSKSGSKLRVLLPDPSNISTMEDMGRRFNRTAAEQAKRISSTMDFFHGLKKEKRKNEILIGLIERVPLFSMFRFGQQAVASFYSHRPELVEVPTFLAVEGDCVFNYLHAEFNYLHKCATSPNVPSRP